MCQDLFFDANEAIEDDGAVAALHVEEAVTGDIGESATSRNHLKRV